MVLVGLLRFVRIGSNQDSFTPVHRNVPLNIVCRLNMRQYCSFIHFMNKLRSFLKLFLQVFSHIWCNNEENRSVYTTSVSISAIMKNRQKGCTKTCLTNHIMSAKGKHETALLLFVVKIWLIISLNHSFTAALVCKVPSGNPDTNLTY